MASTVLAWLLGIPLLGLATGLRTMVPIALCCWFARAGLLPVQGTWAFWLANPVSLTIFTLAALAEIVTDKLPRTPARTAALGLVSRLLFGGLTGAIVATALQDSLPVGALLGVFGATIGTFGGYLTRRHLTHHKRCRDWPVAILEDFCAILIAVFALRLATA